MRELIRTVEQYGMETPDFLFTKIVFRDNNDFFIDSVPSREFNLDALTGLRVPMKTQYLHLPDDIDSPLPAPTPIPADSYIKGVEISSYDHNSIDAEPLGQALIREMRFYEELRPHPHPNVCEYRGYVADDDGRVTGLCFKKYSHTLSRAIWDRVDFDAKALMDDYRNAIDHLHS